MDRTCLLTTRSEISVMQSLEFIYCYLLLHHSEKTTTTNITISKAKAKKT